MAASSTPRPPKELTSKERYERAMAARKAKETQTEAAQSEARRVREEAEQAAREAVAQRNAEAGVEHTQTVMAERGSNGPKALGKVLLYMAVITGVIAVAATIAAYTG